MCELLDKVEQLPPEPSLQKLRLVDFRGGNQLPMVDIAGKDFKVSKPKSLVSLLLQLWHEEEARDLMLKLGTHQIRCNRLRLMCYSEYVRDHLAGGQRQLVLPESRLTAAGVVRIVDWINQPMARLQRRHITQVLSAAIYLQIEPVVLQAWHCLDMASEFSEDQAFVISQEALMLGKRLPTPGLEISMLHRIQRFFLIIVASEEFVQLPLQQLLCLLSSENVAVNNEKEILYAGIRWLNHNWPERSEHVMDIVNTVRLRTLPGNFLLRIQAPTGEPELDCIFQLPALKKILFEINSTQNVLLFDDGSPLFDQLRGIFNIPVPTRRPFLYHNLCPYHAWHHHDTPVDFTYRQFLAYLGLLQGLGPQAFEDVKVLQHCGPFKAT